MKITFRTDRDILYISVVGRIDVSNAPAAEEEIFRIKSENPDKHTVIDADGLEYISSAGLRVILRLRKEAPKLAIINVSSAVYEILEMTGFTDMITVEKAYKRLSLEGCEFIAQGANGAVYRYDDETILKTYFNKDALPEIKQERENARRALVLGINTAIPYGIVRVGEGYGTVTELLNTANVTRLICNDPENLDIPVKYYVDLLRSMHSVEAEEGDFPDMRETVLGWADFLAPHLPEEVSKKLRRLVSDLPKKMTVLHGDYHTSNVMIQNGEPLIIDLDTLCVGHPVFELGSMYNAFLGFSEIDHEEVKAFLGFDRQTSERFWRSALKSYLGVSDEARVIDVENKARVIGYMRLLRRFLRRADSEGSAKRIEHYRNRLIEATSLVDSLDY